MRPIVCAQAKVPLSQPKSARASAARARCAHLARQSGEVAVVLQDLTDGRDLLVHEAFMASFACRKSSSEVFLGGRDAPPTSPALRANLWRSISTRRRSVESLEDPLRLPYTRSSRPGQPYVLQSVVSSPGATPQCGRRTVGAGEDHGARRTARSSSVIVQEARAILGELVKVGRVDLAAKGANVRVALCTASAQHPMRPASDSRGRRR